jgi:hypothetical protein
MSMELGPEQEEPVSHRPYVAEAFRPPFCAWKAEAFRYIVIAPPWVGRKQ